MGGHRANQHGPGCGVRAAGQEPPSRCAGPAQQAAWGGALGPGWGAGRGQAPGRAGRHSLGGAGAQGGPHSEDRAPRVSWEGRRASTLPKKVRPGGEGQERPRAGAQVRTTPGLPRGGQAQHTCTPALAHRLPVTSRPRAAPGGWTHGTCGGTGRTRRTGGCPRNQAILGVAKGRPDPPSKPAAQPRTGGRADRGCPGLSSSLEAPRWTFSGHPASGLLRLTLTIPRTDTGGPEHHPDGATALGGPM